MEVEFMIFALVLVCIISSIFWSTVEKRAKEEELREYEHKMKLEKQELERYYEPMKAEIRTIVTNKLHKLVSNCPDSTGIKLIRKSASYQRISRLDKVNYWDYGNPDEPYKLPILESYEKEVYDHSLFVYSIVVRCKKSEKELFSYSISWDDEVNDYSKEERFKLYKENEEISVNEFLEDIYPTYKYCYRTLNGYNELLDHLRFFWN